MTNGNPDLSLCSAPSTPSTTRAIVDIQYTDVSVCVKVNPYAHVGCIKTECCGDPQISCCPKQGLGRYQGCEITITQTLSIKIPIEYGATADVLKTTVHCQENLNCKAQL